MGSPVLGDHNTDIKICSSIVYQYCDLKIFFFLLVYSIVVSIVIGIVEMLVPGVDQFLK
jgi:hypothetical protein